MTLSALCLWLTVSAAGAAQVSTAPVALDWDFNNALEVLKKEAPELYNKGLAARRIAGERLTRALRGLPRLAEKPELHRDFIEAFKDEIRIDELARKHEAAASPAAKEAAKMELKAALEEAFDARVRSLEARRKAASEEAARLEREVSRRRKDRAKIIGKRLQNLTSQSGDWDW